jgi:hypothetical protein
LGRVAYDDRRVHTVSTLHHVTLGGLRPEIAVYYRIHAGKRTIDQGERPFEATTGPQAGISAPLAAYGQVVDAKEAPASDALVLAWLVNEAGKRQGPLPAAVDEAGYWRLGLPAAACPGATLAIEVHGPQGVQTQQKLAVCQQAQALTLRLQPATG